MRAQPLGKRRQRGFGRGKARMIERNHLRRGSPPAQQALAQQAGVRAVAVFVHPALVIQEDRDIGPIQLHARKRVEDRPRRGAAGHAERRLAVAAQEIGQLPGDAIGEAEIQKLAVRVGYKIHHLISRQRRPSRCISINASSGPDVPAS
jgi:hypothetical protein